MEKLPKSTAKLIKSLQIKKYRASEQSFLVQGAKSFNELIRSNFQIQRVVATPSFYETIPNDLLQTKGISFYYANERELEAVGSFKSNESVIAVVQMPNATQNPEIGPNELAIVLDDIRDPGNLGTIIRTADWFGIKNIIASPTTADFYNPKVINSTMGSFTRVNVFYTELYEFCAKYKGSIFVSDMIGTNIRNLATPKSGLLVMGNESQGVAPFWEKLKVEKVSIPGGTGTESLNVAVACGILLERLTA